MPDTNKELFDPNKHIKQVSDPDLIDSMSDLSSEQCHAIAVGKMLAYAYGSEMLDRFLNDLMTLRISKDRKGRAEFVEGMKTRANNDLADKTKNFHLWG